VVVTTVTGSDGTWTSVVPMSRPTDAPRVTVVVVTWQGRHLLGACLESLRRQTLDHLLLVVDNASTDGTAEFVVAEHPEATLLVSDRNEGFAGGVARALEAVTTPWVALLNNDATAEPDWLAALLEHARAEPTAAAVTSRMLLADPAGVLNNAGVLLLPSGYGADRGLGEPGSAYLEPAEVFGFSGGAAMLRTEAVRDVGGMPRRFFLYYEDTDLSWRLRLAGWTIRYEPRAVVTHLHSATTDQRSESFAHFNERNRLLTLVRCAPVGMALRAVLRFLVTTASLTARRLLRQRVPDVAGFRLRVRLRAFGSFVRLAPWALRGRRSIQRGARVPARRVAGDWAGRVG
jgi:GT2 family glycosyltransferase